MYIQTQTLQYPLSEQDIKLANPNTSYPTPFDPGEPYAWVFPTPQPTLNPVTQMAQQIAPTQINDQWFEVWEVVSKFIEYTDDQGVVHTVAEQEAAAIAADQAQKAQALQDSIVKQTQERLDTFARTRNYDGILSLCTYATDPNPTFAAEGQYGVSIRSSTWAALYAIMSEVEAGERPIPANFQEIESELPVLQWPL